LIELLEIVLNLAQQELLETLVLDIVKKNVHILILLIVSLEDVLAVALSDFTQIILLNLVLFKQIVIQIGLGIQQRENVFNLQV